MELRFSARFFQNCHVFMLYNGNVIFASFRGKKLFPVLIWDKHFVVWFFSSKFIKKKSTIVAISNLLVMNMGLIFLKTTLLSLFQNIF